VSQATDTTPVKRLKPSGRAADDELPRKRWTAEDFDRLVRDGFIVEGSRTYLWDGEIIEPMSENPPHVLAVLSLVELLRERLHRASWTVFQGAPVSLADGYRPQPDVTVARGRKSAYKGKVPAPADVALVVEVSDTSYAKDSGAFLRKYAEVGIPHYWIVNVPARRVEVHTDPAALNDGPPLYRQRHVYGLGDVIPLTLDVDGRPADLGAVAVRDILEDSLEPDAEAETERELP